MKLKPLFLTGLLLCFFIFSVLALPLEDFTTYTISEEVSGRVDVVNATYLVMHGFENETTYTVYDYGADYFSANYIHEVDFMWENITGVSQTYPWIVADITGMSRKQMIDQDHNHLEVHIAATVVRILENDGGIQYYDGYSDTTSGKWYYLSLNKSGTSFTCEIYNNTARTIGYLEDTLTLILHDSAQYYQYIYAGITRDRSVVAYYDLAVSNLDINILDEITPQYHYPYGLNSTLNGSVCQFTVNFSDNMGLTNAYLSWNNSGSWANVSYALSGTVDLALWNQTLNATSGLRIEYLFYVNDTSNNWNTTLQHFIYTNTKPIVLVVSDAGVLFIGALIVSALLGSIFILGKRKR